MIAASKLTWDETLRVTVEEFKSQVEDVPMYLFLLTRGKSPSMPSQIRLNESRLIKIRS